MAHPDTLLIDFGDLPSLVAALLESHPERLVLWHRLPGESDKSVPPRVLEAVHLHRDILKPARLVIARGQETAIAGVDSGGVPEVLEWAQLLMQAMVAAVRLECSRVIWPVRLGLDIERVGAAVEVAQAISDLGVIGEGEEVLIDLPLMDRTEAEVVDLAEDMGCPERAFWPCERDGEQPCGECGGCGEWMRGYEEARYEWPWSVQGAV